jgi:hypothetical protein
VKGEQTNHEFPLIYHASAVPAWLSGSLICF